MLRSETARLAGRIYIDLRGRDLQSAVEEMQRVVAKEVCLPGTRCSGQFGYLERAVGLAFARSPQVRELYAELGVAQAEIMVAARLSNSELPLSLRRRTISAWGSAQYRASRSHCIAAVPHKRLQVVTVSYASGGRSAK